MVQFCHVSLYLGIEIVSCCLLQRMDKDQHGLKLEKVGPTFSSSFKNTMPTKIAKKSLLVVRVEICLISSSRL